MIPQVDFDIVDSILRVLAGWELGNKGLYRKFAGPLADGVSDHIRRSSFQFPPPYPPPSGAWAAFRPASSSR